MKYLLILSMLVGSVRGQAYYPYNGVPMPNPMRENVPGMVWTPYNQDSVVIDTIPCIILCSDTAKHCGYVTSGSDGRRDTNACLTNNGVFYIKGFEVTDIGPHSNTMLALYPAPPPYNRHMAYLDADKKELKLFVWMSQPIKQ